MYVPCISVRSQLDSILFLAAKSTLLMAFLIPSIFNISSLIGVAPPQGQMKKDIAVEAKSREISMHRVKLATDPSGSKYAVGGHIKRHVLSCRSQNSASASKCSNRIAAC
eukprot:scaffold3641_cov120-Cylindrotheca_fusiformis.AAC.3